MNSEDACLAAVRHQLQQHPAVGCHAIEKSALTDQPAPPLDHLRVVVAHPKPVGESAILERFFHLRRAHARRRLRPDGVEVQDSDEVCIDLVGYVDGRILPFSAKSGLWVVGDAPTPVPGLIEALQGKAVGARFLFTSTLSDAPSIAPRRGQRVTYAVRIRAAQSLNPPSEDDPDFLKTLGLGTTLPEVMNTLADVLHEENCATVREEAEQTVLSTLALRFAFIPSSLLVDEEIRHHWRTHERMSLLTQGASTKEQEEALDGWLKDPFTRVEAELRLRICAVLGAISHRDQITVSPDAVRSFFETLAEEHGLCVAKLSQVVRNESRLVRTLAARLLCLATVEHVMSFADVVYEK